MDCRSWNDLKLLNRVTLYVQPTQIQCPKWNILYSEKLSDQAKTDKGQSRRVYVLLLAASFGTTDCSLGIILHHEKIWNYLRVIRGTLRSTSLQGWLCCHQGSIPTDAAGRSRLSPRPVEGGRTRSCSAYQCWSAVPHGTCLQLSQNKAPLIQAFCLDILKKTQDD